MSEKKKSEIREKLVQTRQQLLSRLGSIEEGQWQNIVYSEGSEWTVQDLLRHLVDSERGMTGLMKGILKGREGVPPDFDIHRWNARVIEKAKGKSPADLMAELEESRPILMTLIDSLEASDWHKTGRHPSLRILSIEEICHLIADHEEQHLLDIGKVDPT
jgi:hypothetical protein